MSEDRKNGKSAAIKGRFQPGNPGRKPGSRNRITMACEALLHGQAEALTQRAVELAHAGDTVALRLCIERIYPVPKGRTMRLALPPVDTAEGIHAALVQVITAVAEGEVSAEEAASVAGLLDAARASLREVELEKRFRLIEERLSGKP
jgi:hypothetical protein